MSRKAFSVPQAALREADEPQLNEVLIFPHHVALYDGKLMFTPRFLGTSEGMAIVSAVSCAAASATAHPRHFLG